MLWRVQIGLTAALLAGLGALAPRAAFAEVAPEEVTASSQPTGLVSGELVVKFTEEAAVAIEHARQAGTLPTVGMASLDEFFGKFGVTAIEPVFAGSQDPEAIRERFPERSRRAPPGAELPDLSRTYTVRFDPARDVIQVLLEFMVDPHVESAQPNTLMTIQGPEALVP